MIGYNGRNTSSQNRIERRMKIIIISMARNVKSSLDAHSTYGLLY